MVRDEAAVCAAERAEKAGRGSSDQSELMALSGSYGVAVRRLAPTDANEGSRLWVLGPVDYARAFLPRDPTLDRF